MGTIRFILRADHKGPKKSIGLLYQLSCQRNYFNTGAKIAPLFWDNRTRQAVLVDRRAAIRQGVPADAIPDKDEVLRINRRLNEISREVERIEARYILDKVEFSAADVIRSLRDALSPKVREIVQDSVPDFIEGYITAHLSVRVAGSLQVYRALMGHLRAYEKKTGEGVTFRAINGALFTRFFTFLVDVRGLFNVTACKQLSTLKTLLNYAKGTGIEIPGDYSGFKIRRENLEVIALTEGEFSALLNYCPDSVRLQRVKDLFVFACCTGLRVSDLMGLKWENIKDGLISIRVKKTKELLTVPITKHSAEILSRYSGQPLPLPVISTQKANKYLKELCQLAGITAPVERVRYQGAKRVSVIKPKYCFITIHTGRRVFCSLSLSRGVPVLDVMALGGWRSHSSFKRYQDIANEIRREAMVKAWGGG